MGSWNTHAHSIKHLTENHQDPNPKLYTKHNRKLLEVEESLCHDQGHDSSADGQGTPILKPASFGSSFESLGLGKLGFCQSTDTQEISHFWKGMLLLL